MPRTRKVTAVEAAIILVIVAFVAGIAVTNFAEARLRRRAHESAMGSRALATALESYYVDNRAYPPAVLRRAHSANAANEGRHAGDFRSFALKLPSPGFAAHSLTTPVAYIEAFPPDIFALVEGDTFAYFTDGNGWILVSPGPDRDFDMMMDEGDLDYSKRNDTIERVYDSSIPQPSVTLLTGAGPRGAFTYDPTNGEDSSGDVWRVKQ